MSWDAGESQRHKEQMEIMKQNKEETIKLNRNTSMWTRIAIYVAMGLAILGWIINKKY